MSDLAFDPLNPPRHRGPSPSRWPHLANLPLALAIAAEARRGGGPVLVITPDGYSARRLRDDLLLIDAPQAVLFPDWEVLPYDLYSPHPDLISRRLALMAALPDWQSGIVLAPLTSVMQRLPPVAWVRGQALHLDVGQHLAPDAFRASLQAGGYEGSDQVWQPGHYAVRGAVIDLWPMGAAQPFRLELFDDELESIRTFDAESQRSIERIDRIHLLPGREFPFDEAARQAFRRRFRNRFEIDPRRVPIYREVDEGILSQGLEQYLPLFFDEHATLSDYLPQPYRLIAVGDLVSAAEAFNEQVHARYLQRADNPDRPILAPKERYLTSADLQQWLQQAATVTVPASAANEASVWQAPTLNLEGHDEAVVAELKALGGRVLLAADSAGRRELIVRSLQTTGLRPKALDTWAAFVSGQDTLAVIDLPVSAGCRLPEADITILSEQELFPTHTRTRRSESRSGPEPEALIKSLSDLQSGALVVHLEHGIGRYLGLEVLSVGDHQAEYLTLEYAEGDKLYVPVGDLHLVSRYTGADPEGVSLHRLGSEQWKKTRRKAAERIRDVAAELLDLHARRAARKGHAFDFDDGLVARFSGGFEYEETVDQQQAIDAVLADLASAQPMDRVVCGDVGFGKTEVALRAAFAVTDGGRQVAVLAPTTLLAEQHHRLFADRFADWPVTVRALTRSSGDQSDTLSGLADGKVDIVIGTHRLIQDDVRFANLGLVIVDEEQRFGVRQKERLKRLRAEVDLLTLTATPIPRTLNMAMAGMRDLSIIATPPAQRLAIRTFVGEWEDGLLVDAVNREFQRGGQVYFLHNEVRTMVRMVDQLQRLFPTAIIGMAHGQMPAREMEQVMRSFYARRINLLVASTIIENGIDVPSANTIIINRADRFGLAQLHQLRGRVGRSHHLAYAYLITPPWRSLTSDARKRLEAIQAMEGLGAGFTLASHDLEIRGAGELLGEEQSGQIEAIGFSLYSDMLARAVDALKRGVEPDLDEPLAVNASVDLHTAALIPDDYLPDVHQRLVLYKRISQANDEAGLNALEVEMIDRFGLLPIEIKQLFSAARLRLRARALGISHIELGPEGGRIELGPKPNIDVGELLNLIQRQPDRFALSGEHRLRLLDHHEEADARRALVDQVLTQLTPKVESS